MKLIEFFEQHNLSANLLTEISQATIRERLPRNYHLLLPGNHSKKIFFFEDGFARTYYYKNGKDITHYFYKENDSFGPLESIFHNRPSRYGLELLEDSTIYTIQYPQIVKYLDNSLEVNKLVRMIAANSLLAFYDRMDNIQFHSARERYNHLLENYPGILLHAPLRHIASYLGITQPTLSVIRSKNARISRLKRKDPE